MTLSFCSPFHDRSHSYDAADNILQINDGTNAPLNQLFTYDGPSRLVTATGGYGDQAFDYDLNSNRTHFTDNGLIDEYLYKPDNHHLTAINRDGNPFKNYQYDENGNTIDNGEYQFTYGDHNRLVKVTQAGSLIAEYTYNADGQRVKKINWKMGEESRYFYHLNGQLLAETDGTSHVTASYIYLDQRPIAIIQNAYTAVHEEPEQNEPEFIVVDNSDPGFSFTGKWRTENTASGYQGSDYLYRKAAGKSNQNKVNVWMRRIRQIFSGFTRRAQRRQSVTATWSLDIQEQGQYAVYVNWPVAEQQAENAKYTVYFQDGMEQHTVNQRQNGGEWRRLGEYPFIPGQANKITLSGFADGRVVADAVAIQLVDANAQTPGLNDANGFTGQDNGINNVGNAPAIALDEGIETDLPALEQAVYYVHSDHLGTPQRMTDENQLMVWHAEYDPFGHAQLVVFQALNNLRFPGQYFDVETGLYYNWNRFYDPGIGRYISSDPIGLQGGLNTYGYVGGNPVQYIDPTGHLAILVPIVECLLNPVCAGGVVAIIGVSTYVNGVDYGDAANDEEYQKCSDECDPPEGTICYESHSGGKAHKRIDFYGNKLPPHDVHVHTWQMNKSPDGCRWNKVRKKTYNYSPLNARQCFTYPSWINRK